MVGKGRRPRPAWISQVKNHSRETSTVLPLNPTKWSPSSLGLILLRASGRLISALEEKLPSQRAGMGWSRRMFAQLATNSVLILQAVCAHGCSDEAAVVLAQVSQ